VRVKRGNVRRKKHNKVLELTSGFKGGRGTQFGTSMQAMMRALKRAYTDRRKKKRDFRGLWIQRINAAANMHDISYSRMIDGLNKANIIINRKMLAEIAVDDANAFEQLVKLAKVK
jgi:large subunit ribosomal protein L20